MSRNKSEVHLFQSSLLYFKYVRVILNLAINKTSIYEGKEEGKILCYLSFIAIEAKI